MLFFRLLYFCLISVFLVKKDIKSFILPDLYVFLLLLGLVLFDCIYNKAFIANGLIGFFSAGIFFLLTYYLSKHKIGFGDVKYSAVIGYLLGVPNWIFAIIISCLSAIIFFYFGNRIYKWNISKRIPFGPFLAAGSIIISLWSIY